MRYHFSTFSTKKGSMYLNNTATLAICNFKLFVKFERSISQLYLYGEYNTKSNLFSLFQENVFSSNNEHILRNENSKTQWEKKKSLSQNCCSQRWAKCKGISPAPLFLTEGRTWACVDETWGLFPIPLCSASAHRVLSEVLAVLVGPHSRGVSTGKHSPPYC